MEQKLLSAVFKNRDVYEQAKAHLDLKQYSKEFEAIFKSVEEHYTADRDAVDVDVEIVKRKLAATISSDKQYRRLEDIIDAAHSLYVSIPNVSNFILESKRYQLENSLATAFINHSDKDIQPLLDEYLLVREATDLEEVDEAGAQVFSGLDINQLITEKLDESKQIRILPKALADKVGGGVSGGHHILLFGPPEVGKSALAITVAAGFLRQGLPGLYIENEEPARDTVARFVYNLSGLDKYQIRDRPDEANEKALKHGYNLLTVVDLPGGTTHQLDALVKRYKPKWMVVNQLLNLNVKAENEAVKLKNAAQAMRYLAKKYDVIVISVSQADGKAIGKAILELGDVYYSNIAVQGAVDLMIGIGMTPELEAAGQRCLSLPKNKLSGDHGHVYVAIDPQLSRMRSIG